MALPLTTMNGLTSTVPIIARGGRTLVDLVKGLVDPAIVLSMLFLSCWWHGRRVGAPEVILAVIAFSITYPGSIPFRRRKFRLLREIISSWGIVVGLLLVLGYTTGYLSAVDHRVISAWILATPVALWLVHAASPLLVPRIVALQNVQSSIVVGANEIGLRLAQTINNDAFTTQQVVAFFDDRAAERLGPAAAGPLMGKLNAVAEFVRTNRVSTIYIALPMASQPRILHLLDTLRDTTASIYFVPDIFMFDLIQARVDAIGSVPVVAVCESPFHGTTGLMKRLSDILMAAVALALAGPMMVVCALAIKLSSPGPVIFKQRRYGLDGAQIVIWKFRTMRVMEDGEQVRQASRHDDRVTSLGAFLRRTSIDELPQLINVLQGRMSMVGPRPHAVAHNETYRKLIKGYMIRHKVKPGITGWAQVNGARGETTTVDQMQRRIELDLQYLRHWSLRLDVQILCRTGWLLLRGDSKAY